MTLIACSGKRPLHCTDEHLEQCLPQGQQLHAIREFWNAQMSCGTDANQVISAPIEAPQAPSQTVLEQGYTHSCLQQRPQQQQQQQYQNPLFSNVSTGQSQVHWHGSLGASASPGTLPTDGSSPCTCLHPLAPTAETPPCLDLRSCSSPPQPAASTSSLHSSGPVRPSIIKLDAVPASAPSPLQTPSPLPCPITCNLSSVAADAAAAVDPSFLRLPSDSPVDYLGAPCSLFSSSPEQPPFTSIHPSRLHPHPLQPPRSSTTPCLPLSTPLSLHESSKDPAAAGPKPIYTDPVALPTPSATPPLLSPGSVSRLSPWSALTSQRSRTTPHRPSSAPRPRPRPLSSSSSSSSSTTTSSSTPSPTSASSSLASSSSLVIHCPRPINPVTPILAPRTLQRPRSLELLISGPPKTRQDPVSTAASASHSATVEDPPFDLFSPAPTVSSSQLSTTPALAVALRPHSRRSTPVQTTVFITTTDITGRGEKDCFRNSNNDHLSPQHQQRHRRPVLNRGRPPTGIEIQPLCQSPQHPHDQQRRQQQQDQTQEREHTFPVQSDFPAQVQGTLDFLEYLETYVASEDETKALERQRRLQSWTAVKDFISHRILRLNRNHKDESEDNVGYHRPRHFNHSSPLIDRSLLTPSPSPSLPTLRSAPLPFSLSRPSSPIPSVASTPEPSSTQRPYRPSSLHGRSSLTGTGTGALSSASSTVHTATHYRSASAGPSCYRSSSTRARNQLQSSTPVAATSSPSSSSYTIPRIIHTPPPSAMSSHTGSLLSSPISPTGTPCSSVLVPRSPFRKTSGSQHPLANVSTFDSGPEAYLASDEPLVLSSDALRNECQASVTPSQKPAYYEEPAQELASTKTVIEEALTGQNDITTAPELSMLMDSKHKTLGMVKSAFKSGSPQALVLTLKSEMSERSHCGAQEPNVTQLQNTNHSGSAAESDWATVAVASSVDQPLSPLTAAYPTTTSQSLVVPDRTEDLGSRTAPVAVQQSARSSTSEGSETGSSSPRRDFEKWTPPPPKPRPSQDAQRQSQPLRQPHSRLHLPRLLKQRSLNFTFSSSSPSSSTPASPSSPQHSFPLARASMDGFLRRASTGPSPTEQRSMTTTSCDLPRPIGPPDPIPPHYQHLQNRHGRRSTSSFRRRSHGGELERFSPGWIVAENAAAASVAAASSPSDHRLSRTGNAEHEEASQRRRHSTTPSRRHVSLGLQPNLSSMWGRLLTSIFSSGPGSDNGENEQRDGEGGASTPRELSSEQQRLLLTPLSQQQQVHPLYQQQLFFYADEVIDSDLEDMAINNNRRRSTSEASGLRRNSTSLLTALATDASLQGELAQEDGRESLEMADLSDMVIVRPETLLGGDGSLVPKTLSPEGKISVASLALSSPPSYWEAAVKYQGWPQIDKRPEQGQESLPRYSCSVFREGCVNRKTELVGNWRPYRRPWKRTFAHLRGTALRLYAVDMEDVPRLHVRNISLQLAKCEIAADYKQRPNVIRIQACDRTVLLECKDRIDALTWLEHLQAAANISTSLEDRSMPKFYTLPRAQHHPAAHSGSGSRSSSSSTASNRYHSSGGGSQLQQQQQQQQSSMSQAPQAPPTRQQQLQQQLQEQQEQILMQQRYAQRLQRARQLVVQSSESASSTMSPTLSRASLGSSDTAAGSSLSLVTPPSSGYNTTAFGRRSPEGDRLQPRRTRSSLLMSRSERHRTITEAALQGDRDTRLDDGVTMRSVLQALGQNTDSGSSIGESDQGSDLDEDEDGDEDGRGCGSGADVEVAEPRRSRAVTTGPRASGSSTDPLNRIAQRARFHTSQESTGSHGPCGQRGSFASGEAFNGRQCPSQDYWERSSASHHNPLRIHLTQIQQQQDQQHQGRRQQRASWNRRLFGGLWGHPPLEHSQQQQQQHQQQQQQREQHPLQLQARGEGHGHQEHQQQQEQPLTAST